MKNIKYHIIGYAGIMAAVLLFAVSASLAQIQPREEKLRFSTDNAVEFSLMSLRNSAEEVEEKNQWLRQQKILLEAEMVKLRHELEMFKQQKEAISQNASAATENKDVGVKQVEILQKSLERLKGDQQQLKAEQLRLKTQFDERAKKDQEINNLVKQEKDEIADIQSRLAGIQQTLDTTLSAQKESLLQEIKESQRVLQDAEQTLHHLQKQHQKPLQSIEQLSAQQKELKEKWDMLTHEMDLTIKEEEAIRQQIASLESEQKAKVENLDGDIQQFQSRQQELGQILLQAQKKINGQNIDFKESIEQSAQMESNLSFIQQENEKLKDELMTLQHILQSRQTTP